MTAVRDAPVRHHRVANWKHLIQAENREMPGLSLTQAQMQRLWGLEATTCQALIETLVAAQVLRCTSGGAYVAYGRGH